jgi:penicillin amidase
MMKKLLVVIGLLCGFGLVFWSYLQQANDFQVTGKMNFFGLDQDVDIRRDEYGMAYILAKTDDDLWRAQGFVTAQHRLFQMISYFTIVRSEMSSVLGESLLPLDKRMIAMGLRANARKHMAMLNDADLRALNLYLEGVNAYIEFYQHEHPLELSLGLFKSRRWELLDLVSLIHFGGFIHSTNMTAELLTAELVGTLGRDLAAQILPLSRNPDRTGQEYMSATLGSDAQTLGLKLTSSLTSPISAWIPRLGSNNWAVNESRSTTGAVIVVNDPHLDVRSMPGMLHPIGLQSPHIQAVGYAFPGVPGLIGGRTNHVAFGVTNAYGDVQDLYVETVNPTNDNEYKSGTDWLTFERHEHTFNVRDSSKEAGYRVERVQYRKTIHGIVASDLGLFDDKLPGLDISLRWALDEGNRGGIGVVSMMYAKDVFEFDQALAEFDTVMFNFVFGDTKGNIGRRSTGRIPIRSDKNGAYIKDGATVGSHWQGWIPKDEMPGQFNPARGWVGTANNDTRSDDYPYYYSSGFAPSFRYQRVAELIEGKPRTSPDDHLGFMLDIKNLQAEALMPHVLAALQGDPAFEAWMPILESWNFEERIDLVAPSLYHAIYHYLAYVIVEDDLGEEGANNYTNNWYFWQERVQHLIGQEYGEYWIDDQRTIGKVENLHDMIRRAAKLGDAKLRATSGLDPTTQKWGEIHKISFVSPLRRSGLGSRILGGGSFAKEGSGETLNRAGYARTANIEDGFDSAFAASARLVMDLADAEKIKAVVAGGVTARQFNDHYDDQIPVWADGELLTWWLSKDKILESVGTNLTLTSKAKEAD